MAKFGSYLKEAYSELMYKVSWPSWEELQNSTIIVMIASLLIGLIIFLIDKVFSMALSTYYHMF